jgi:hypothetical protein
MWRLPIVQCACDDGGGLVIYDFQVVLRLAHEMNTYKPLMAYGLESLAAVEMRNWVRMELDVELSIMDILNASSQAASVVEIRLPMPTNFAWLHLGGSLVRHCDLVLSYCA